MIEKNWVDSLVAECSDVETPRSWIWWSLISAVSAVSNNNYYVMSFNGKVKYNPNLYVMLLGESGLGKGFPINLSKLLVKKADVTRVIAGRSSIQAIVQELGTSRTSPNGKPPFTDSRGFIVNGELSSAIIADPDALTILTDLYDGHYNPEWENMLKGEGIKKLKDPCITALFGSSPAHFYDSIPQANIEGGYIGRNLIVYEEKRFQDLDMFGGDKEDSDQLNSRIIPHFAEHLVKISKGKGRLLLTDAAKGRFNSWRRTWRATQPPDKTGFINRVPDHVIKVSMCLALSRYDSDGIIGVDDVDVAIEKITGLLYANKMTTDGKGLDPLAGQTKLVLEFLIAAPDNELSRKKLLSKGYGNYQADGLDRIIENLLEMGWISRERFVAGTATDWIIKLAGEPLQNYKDFIRRQDNARKN